MKIELPPELTKIALDIGATHYDVFCCDFLKKVGDVYAYYSGTYPIGKWVNGVSGVDGVLEIDFTPPKAELLAEIERLKAALDKQWLPIETAPKDGTLILLCSSGCSVWMGHWIGRSGAHVINGWTRYNCVDMNWNPTHWMPRPSNPEE